MQTGLWRLYLTFKCVILSFFFFFLGLIEYNFHCFRKAIHEVFEVGTSPQDASSSSNNLSGLKYAAMNGSAI